MGKTGLALVTALLLTAPMARATMVVGWHAASNYVTTVRYFRMPVAVDTGGTRTWPYSFDTPISPAPLYYTGPDFFGALEITMGSGTPAGPMDNCVRGDQDGTLRFWAPNTAGGFINYMRGLFFFKPVLRPGQSIDKLTGGDSLAITFTTTLGNNRKFRMALRSGGDWYLSGTYATGTFTLENLDQQMWGLWDPTGAPLAAAPAVYDVPGSALADIQGVGFHFDVYETRGDGRGVRISISDFAADLTVPVKGTCIIVR